MNNRIPYIDAAKGLSIIAVVLSHEFSSVKPLVLFLNSFMLPAFFFLSGVCTNVDKYTFRNFTTHRFKSLIIPYLGLGAIVSALSLIWSDADNVIGNISQSLFSWQTLWFLPVLFLASVIAFAINKLCKSDNKRMFTASILFLSIGSILDYKHIIMAMSLSTTFVAVFYIVLGCVLRKYVLDSKYMLRKSLPFVFALFLLVISTYDSTLNLNGNAINPVYKKVLGSMIGIAWLLLVCKLILDYGNKTSLNYMLVFIKHGGGNYEVCRN